MMIKLQAFRFKLRPTDEQRRLLGAYAGCSRFVYNKALALQKERHDQGQKKLSYPDIARELVMWKKQDELAFLKEAPAQILQQKLMDLEKAYKNFFQKRAGFPKFRKKGIHDSFRFPEPKSIIINSDFVTLPKLGRVRFWRSRPIVGTIKNATLSLKGRDWYISFQTESECQKPIHELKSIVGIDVGIAQLVTLSDGTQVAPLNPTKTYKAKLARAQKALARKKKRSQNRKKQIQKVAKIHEKISNCRKDYLHKITTNLSKNHAMIVLEDLSIKNMSRSAAGTIDKPGKYVRAKSGLNRLILDQGWGEMRRQLEYKQLWCGGDVLFINPQHTSQMCHACGHVSSENRKTQSCFVCVSCGMSMNADVNAAKNLLAAGHAVIACGETVRPRGSERKSEAVSMKQEPFLKNQAAA
jgi:putative transposase